MSTGVKMTRKNIWATIVFISGTTIAALIGAPLYIHRFGISASEILLALFFVAATGLSITVGYHRLYAHSTFKTNRFVQFLILFFGAAAFEQTALAWSSLHRDHHRYVDTDLDPYSIKKGFFYAHIGWIFFWEHAIDSDNSKDLLKDPLVMHQHRYYIAWALTAGVLLPLLLGALSGHALGAFIFAVCARLTFVYQSTFCINSVCHTLGKATYDIYATAKDHWFVAILTNGEGYHNFHHRFPTDYRNGVRWYHWDPSKWAIAILARLGLAWNLKTVSKFSILEARLAAENQAMHDRLLEIKDHPRFAKMREALQAQYASLTQHLSAWESSAKSYQALISKQVADYSNDLMAAAFERAENAKLNFRQARRQWNSLIRSATPDLQYA